MSLCVVRLCSCMNITLSSKSAYLYIKIFYMCRRCCCVVEGGWLSGDRVRACKEQKCSCWTLVQCSHPGAQPISCRWGSTLDRSFHEILIFFLYASPDYGEPWVRELFKLKATYCVYTVLYSHLWNSFAEFFSNRISHIVRRHQEI